MKYVLIISRVAENRRIPSKWNGEGTGTTGGDGSGITLKSRQFR